MQGPARKPSRFPYVAALLCAACVGAAAWTWMRYSYCWDAVGLDKERLREWEGRYVLISGHILQSGPDANAPGAVVTVLYGGYETALRIDATPGAETWIPLLGRHRRWNRGEMQRFEARLVLRERFGSVPFYCMPGRRVLVLDLTSGRCHGASIAGLVVGAMGVFVFAVALRHWLGGVKR